MHIWQRSLNLKREVERRKVLPSMERKSTMRYNFAYQRFLERFLLDLKLVRCLSNKVENNTKRA